MPYSRRYDRFQTVYSNTVTGTYRQLCI